MSGLESGQISNHRKCTLFFSCKTPWDLARLIKKALGIQNTPDHTNYLGDISLQCSWTYLRVQSHPVQNQWEI